MHLNHLTMFLFSLGQKPRIFNCK